MTARRTRLALLGHTALGVLALAAAAPAAGQAITAIGTVTPNSNGGAGTGFATIGSTQRIALNNQRTVLDWNSFNLASGTTLEFIFANRGDVALNRVLTGAASIDGAINSFIGASGGATGGNVWFSAPGGVVFGGNAVVNVGGLLATTGSISNADFFGGDLGFTFSGAGASSSVTVDAGAQLNVNSGTLALIAPVVSTAAGSTISGGAANNDSDVLFGAAEEYTITFAPDADGDLDLLSWTVPAEAMGSDAATPIALAGTTSGGNVYLGAVSRRIATTAAINIDGTVTANGASASGDGDIVLSAGSGITSGAPAAALGRNVNLTLAANGTANRDLVASAGGNLSFPQALNTGRHMVLTAGGDLSVSNAPIVGGDYSITADDFTGSGSFAPNFGAGTTNDFSITDTAGGTFFGFGGKTAPGTFSITATNGGSVNINGTLTSTNESINLSGSSVNLGANLTASNGAINVTGPVTLSSGVTAAGGSVSFGSTIDGGFGLTVNATTTTFGGNIGGTTALTSVTTNTGGTTTIGGNVSTTAQQTYNDAVLIPNTTTLATTGGGIALNGSVNGPGALTLSSFSAATIGGAVGGATPLASLTTGSHSLALNGGSVTTTGAQSYGGAVTFGANTTLTSTGSGNITLGSGSNGALTSGGQSLTINTSGSTVINSLSGNPLSSLTTDAGGSVTASSVTTTGAQTFNGTSLALAGNFTTTNSAFTANGPVTFGGNFNTISTGSGAVSFGSTVDGVTAFQQRLTVNSTGATTFSGNVGSSVPLLWLASDIGTGCVACGSISLRSVSSLTQQYFDSTATLNGTYTVAGSTFDVAGATTLAGATTINATDGAVNFDSTINGAQALNVTAFSVAIDGNVGATTALASINANSAGSNFSTTNLVFGGSLRTSGNATLAAKGNVNVVGALNVSGDYSVTGQDFLGNALSPTFTGTTNDFTIVDTAGGLTLAAKTAPGTLNVTTTNGGALTTSGALVSTNESIALITTGGGNISLGGNLTTGTAAGRSITFNGSGSISYSAGALTTNTLAITAAGSFAHGNGLNNVSTLAASSAGNGFQLSDADSFAVSGNVSSGSGNLGLVAGGGTLSIGAVTLQSTGTGFVSLAAPTIALGGSTISAGGIAALGGNTTLTGSNSVTAGANASFQGTINGPGSLLVNSPGETQFQDVVGGTTALASLTTDAPGTVVALNGGFTTAGDLTFNDAAQLTGTLSTGNGNFTAGGALTLFGNVIVNAGSGSATFGSTVDGVIANGRSLTVNSTGATSFAAAVGGTAALSSLTTNAGGTTSLRDVTTAGAQTFNDAVTLNGTYTAGQNFAARQAATLAGDTTISTGGGFTAAFDSTLDADAAANNRSLTINAANASSTTYFQGNVGASQALGSLTLNASGGSVLGASGGTRSINVSGHAQFGFVQVVAADATVNAGTASFGAINAEPDAGSHSLTVTGGDASFTGTVGAATRLASLTVNGGGATSLAGNVSTSGAISLTDAITLAGNIALDSNAGGAVTLGTVTGGTNSLSVSNGTGAQTFNGIVAMGGLTLTGTGTRTLNAGTYDVTAADAAFDFGAATLNGALTIGQATTFGATTLGSNVTVDGGAHALTFGTVNGGFGLTATTTGALSSGAIGGTTAPTAVTLTGGSLTANGATSSGDINLAATNGDLTLAGGVLTAPNVTLSASGAFLNQAGTGAINAGTRWLVYSANSAGNTFGGLDSGSTALWNGTLATRAPGTITGNRYVFAQQPTLTFTSTNASKTYGDLLALSNQFSVSGLQPGVAGAYLADIAGTAFAGAPALTSAGTAANASVAGGPYAIGIAQGTLTSSAGYAFAFNGTGQLSVTPKALTATVTANNKTYDGTTAATGSVALSGVVAGDAVAASGSFAFADPNAGTGKTVNLSGVALSGADAGNYTLAGPATTLADILRRAITVTADAKTKANGAADPALTFAVSSGSLVTGDTLAGGLSRAAGEAPGDYAIGVGTLSGLPNYELSFIGSMLTIQPAAVTPPAPTPPTPTPPAPTPPLPPEPTPPTAPSVAARMPESLSEILDRVDFRTDTGLVESEGVVVDDREYACGNGEENCRVR